MVKLEFTGICKGCTDANLELDCTRFSALNRSEMQIWNVTCSHEGVCNKWKKTVEGLEDELAAYKPTE